jgi:hypothetical protein
MEEEVMRVMLKLEFEVAAGNRAIQDGSLPKLIQEFVQKHKPEASYFLPHGGTRSAIFFLDLKDVSQIPTLVEPWWMIANAKVEVVPAMNAEDLAKGIGALEKQGR